ncbi:TetR/AcrR family transcriptional regulator [Streptomyces sp. NPDC005708]|uniref:TetR/AcrR family transcriptional regulator n=1 Tax=Streptomyces sp. NPDC005708 TaxID=3154564 RepID=UPI0033DEF2ED
MASKSQETGERLSDETAPTARLTKRGLRTRTALVKGAAAVFARDGFLDARITDICREAKVAYGTFYTYFQSKEEIFREVILDVQEDMATAHTSLPTASLPTADAAPWDLVEFSNRQYLVAYRRNAKLMATLEQVATFNEEIRQQRLDLRNRFVNRNAKAIARWQEQGIADPDLDPVYAANALGQMVDRFAYTWFVLGQEFDEELAVETLTRLWLQALGVDHGRHRARPATDSENPAPGSIPSA